MKASSITPVAVIFFCLSTALHQSTALHHSSESTSDSNTQLERSRSSRPSSRRDLILHGFHNALDNVKKVWSAARSICGNDDDEIGGEATPSPTISPTVSSSKPTPNSSPGPTPNPSPGSSTNPSNPPTNQPTKSPVVASTPAPSKLPSPYPTNQPTKAPTLNPTNPPSPNPTPSPTLAPILPPVGNPSSSFNIQLDLLGVADAFEFQNAVDKWGEVITGDLPDHQGYLGGHNPCGSWPNEIDDLYMCGTFVGIDGPGGIVGSAGPRHWRQSSGLPLTGVMEFDSNDVFAESFPLWRVILHEMVHVLGIGPLWVTNGLTNSYEVPCPYKLNSAASREYEALSGCNGVTIPVEQNFQFSGSNCGHWDEDCFGHEIMTPIGTSDLPISRLTIAALEDLEYQVNYEKADPYDASKLSSSCRCGSRVRRRLLNETSLSESGVHTKNAPRRRLSDEGRQRAIAYGRDLLTKNKASMAWRPGNIPDIGGEVVHVLFEEDGIIHSIMVTALD